MTSPSPDDVSRNLFQEPAPRVGRPPLSATSTSTTPAPDTSAPPDSPPLPESSTPPGPSSSTEPPRAPTSDLELVSAPGSTPGSGDLRQQLSDAIVSGTQAAHNTLTDDVGRSLGQYLSTHEETAGIADGAAGLIERRIPNVGNPDLMDALKILVHGASYVGRQWRTWKAARKARAQIAASAQASGTATPEG